jgi:hypothetical protein
MIVLQTTSQSLRAVLTASTSTTQFDLTAIYFDYLPQRTDTNPRNALSVTTTLNLTSVTLVPAPAADGIVRNISNVFSNNADVTTQTLIIKLVDGAAEKIQVKRMLSTGQTLQYEHGGAGWSVL